MSKPAKVQDARLAGEDHAVLTVTGGDGGWCREPCAECPWRVDRTGSFPAKAFLLSARTAHDMSGYTFACHMAGSDRPKTCAGFLVNGAADNLRVRVRRAGGEALDATDGGHELHASYKAMAVANGCAPAAPELERCMPEARFRRFDLET